MTPDADTVPGDEFTVAFLLLELAFVAVFGAVGVAVVAIRRER